MGGMARVAVMPDAMRARVAAQKLRTHALVENIPAKLSIRVAVVRHHVMQARNRVSSGSPEYLSREDATGKSWSS